MSDGGHTAGTRMLDGRVGRGAIWGMWEWTVCRGGFFDRLVLMQSTCSGGANA